LFETDPIKILPLDQWHLTLHAKGDAAAFLNRIQEELRSFPKQPDLTLVFSSFRVETNQLKETIDSLTKQYYSHWELRIPDEWKLNSEIQKFIDQICKTEPRIKWGRQDFTRADPYVVLLDPGDSLLPDALFEFVRHLNYFPDTDFIYSDENRISSNGSYLEPFYKPGWCPDSFLSRNYIGSLALVKREIAIQAGKLNPHFSAAQLYDFYLRVTELTNRISHIPKILYNRKNCNNEGASGVQALREALIRRRENGRVDLNRSQTACYTIRYTPAEPHEISILIPTKDQTSILKKCIDSIYSKTTYPNFELIVVSNNSNDPTLFSLLKAYQATHGSRFRFYENNIPFNFSKLMNEAASQASGKSLLFLNNDIEVISPDWIQEMAGQAERSSVGAVGCKLLYFNETIQHAGIIMGMKNNLVSHKFLGADRNDSCYFNQLNTVNNYSAVTAACLMCNKERFHEVNGFDESLQISFNDVDFCLKLREKGYHNVYLPHVELYHHESLTRGSVSATPDSLERFTIELDIMRERWSRYLIQDPCHSKHLNFL
jgi:GT2 family glycosyltransferase